MLATCLFKALKAPTVVMATRLVKKLTANMAPSFAHTPVEAMPIVVRRLVLPYY